MLTDVLYAGYMPGNLSVLKAELRTRHRVRERAFLLNFIPPGSVGVELGVFTGLFSSVLARQQKIARVTFVDPWWKAFGETYPDWGTYTDFGRVNTHQAFAIAKTRIARAKLPNRIVEASSSYDWLERQPDESLDWAYLDSTHTYEGTKRELSLLDRKIKGDGLILGDDWQWNRSHRHHGVALAANEFTRVTDFEFVLCGFRSQWIIRRSSKEKYKLPLLWRDELDTTIGSHAEILDSNQTST